MITRDRLAQLDFETRNGGPSTLLSGELRELAKVYVTHLEGAQRQEMTTRLEMLEIVAKAARRLVAKKHTRKFVPRRELDPFFEDLEVTLRCLEGLPETTPTANDPERRVSMEVDNAFDTLAANGVDDSWQK